MATLTFCGNTYSVDHAVKGSDYIHGFNEYNELIVAFEGVTDFSKFAYDGDYMTPEQCLQEKCNNLKHIGSSIVREDGTEVVNLKNILYLSDEIDADTLGGLPAGDYATKAQLAKVEQTTPLFVNSIEECTDTSQLYVLPDGYIYAYMSHVEYPFTNQIPRSINTDGTLYIGTNGEAGYKTGYRLNSAGTETEASGVTVTGFIPVNDGDTVYFGNFRYKIGEPASGDFKEWLVIYDSNFSVILAIPSGQFDIANFGYLVSAYTVDEETGYLTSLTLYDKYNSGVSYIRVSAREFSRSTVVSVNEEIVFDGVVTYSWKNTGHAFVPADYEDRIIQMEENTKNLDARVETLELNGASDVETESIPVYIKNEADDVINRVMAVQGNRNFTMIGMSDFHYQNVKNWSMDNRDNLIRASKAVSYINRRMHIDAVVTLGDNTPFGAADAQAFEWAHQWNREINEILEITDSVGVKRFRTPGNHDRLGGVDENGVTTDFLPDNVVYSYYGGYSDGIMGDVPGGWCHYDFESCKLRVIVLNTAECEGVGRFSEYSGYRVSTKQYNWLIETLDMSGKDDATDWQILILSHHRPDVYQEPISESAYGENGYILPNILHAYRTGSGFTGTKPDGDVITCDFSGKNQAALIGSIHGHHHDFKYGNLYLGPNTNSNQCEVMAIGTPTLGFGTDADHNEDNDGNGYPNVKDTADETAFCVYSIDLDARKIYAIHYGAGVDREIPYSYPDVEPAERKAMETETWTFELEDGTTVTKQVVVTV